MHAKITQPRSGLSSVNNILQCFRQHFKVALTIICGTVNIYTVTTNTQPWYKVLQPCYFFWSLLDWPNTQEIKHRLMPTHNPITHHCLMEYCQYQHTFFVTVHRLCNNSCIPVIFQLVVQGHAYFVERWTQIVKRDCFITVWNSRTVGLLSVVGGVLERDFFHSTVNSQFYYLVLSTIFCPLNWWIPTCKAQVWPFLYQPSFHSL